MLIKAPDGNEWTTDLARSHHPMDRIGGPFPIDHVIDQYGGSQWFLFAYEYCWFPAYILVRADDIYDALESLECDYKPIHLTEDDVKDIPEEERNMNCDGVYVDIENIVDMWHGKSVKYVVEDA